MGIDDSSEGDYHRSNDLSDDLANSTRNPYLLDRLSKTEFQQLVSKLNTKQREYLMHVTDHIRYNHERTQVRMLNSNSETVKTFKPFYHFVTGGAGFGKSMLIKALYESSNREFDNNRDLEMNTPPVLLTAPTGKAVFKIKGQTLHGAFMLPVSQFGKSKKLNKLSADVTHFMSITLKDLQVLIIDKISMVGTTIFSWVDMRLKYIFDASPLYSTKMDSDPYVAVFGTDLWKNLFEVHKLDQIIRQRDDLHFAVALNNMAGKKTADNIKLIQSRVVNMTENEMKSLENNEVIFLHLCAITNDLPEENRLICLFHSNKEVRDMNTAILQNMTTESVISLSFDRVTGSNTGNQTAVQFVLNHVSNDSVHQMDNMSLLKNLNLKTGDRYMITINIDTTDGLVNGTTGYLKKN